MANGVFYEHSARLLRSSLTHQRMRSLRSSAPNHHLGHLATR